MLTRLSFHLNLASTSFAMSRSRPNEKHSTDPFQGTVKGLLPFLSSMGLNCPSYHNPADFVMEIATGEYGPRMDDLVGAVRSGKCELFSVDQSPLVPHKMSNGEAADLEADSISTMTKENSPARTDSGAVLLSSMRSDVRIKMTDDSCNSADGESEQQASLLGSVESVDEHCRTFPTSTWTQFRVLFLRTFRSIIRDETLTKLRVISHIAIGLLLGMLYWNIGNEASKVRNLYPAYPLAVSKAENCLILQAFNNSAMLFFCMLFSMFTAMMPTVMTFPMEMATFKREHLNYWYSMKSYYMAKVMADMPFQILFPLIFVVIVYLMTSQPLEFSRIGMFTGMCILTSLVAQSLGLVIGCACDVQSAVYLGPITTIPILLFSGERVG